MTAGVLPATAAESCCNVVTTWGVALPPPVVPPLSEAQPISGLGSGGVMQPPVPVVPAVALPPVPLPAAPPRPAAPPCPAVAVPAAPPRPAAPPCPAVAVPAAP